MNCEKETENRYECYSADVLNSSRTTTGNAVQTVQTTVTYGNFEHHTDYLCSACHVDKQKLRRCYVYLVVFIILAIVWILFPTIINALSTENAINLIEEEPVLYFALMLLPVCLILYTLKSISNIKRIWAENAPRYKSRWTFQLNDGLQIYRDIIQKKNPKRAVFFPQHYEQLMKQNALQSQMQQVQSKNNSDFDDKE